MEHNKSLIRKIQMDCPLCDRIHEIEVRTRMTNIIIRGEEVEYEETYFLCPNSDKEEQEFVTGQMENENLLKARNAYRRNHGLLTTDEIIAIRKVYGLSQVDLAKLLGWGEATISRYESKAIQDETYDTMLRLIKENPYAVLDFIQKNGEKFSKRKKLEIEQRIMDHLNEEGKEFLQRKSLESEYVDYQEPCDENGYRLLDIDKLETIISYIAKRVTHLYKVRLMKMLWYADALFFKEHGIAMTGLVYCHDDMGALPIGHYQIVGLEKVNTKMEEEYEYTKYHFLPNDKLDESILSDQEKDVLDRVINKFISFNAQEIVRYMHKETAYIKTKDGEVIPFCLAKEIKRL